MKSQVKEYPENSVIFSEGEVGHAAYILTEGSVEIFVQNGGKKSVVSVLKPISVFGEMALLLKNQKRTASAVAKTPAKVAEICKKDFENFIEKSPKLIGAVLNVLVERLQKTTSMVSQSPDLFLGVAHMLSLLQSHTIRMVKYDQAVTMIKFEPTVQSLAKAFLADPAEIRRILESMETLSLLEIRVDKNQKYLEILRKEDFLERCHKIRETFSQYAEKTGKS